MLTFHTLTRKRLHPNACTSNWWTKNILTLSKFTNIIKNENLDHCIYGFVSCYHVWTKPYCFEQKFSCADDYRSSRPEIYNQPTITHSRKRRNSKNISISLYGRTYTSRCKKPIGNRAFF